MGGSAYLQQHPVVCWVEVTFVEHLVEPVHGLLVPVVRRLPVVVRLMVPGLVY